MDPNANVQERISLLLLRERNGSWTAQESDRYVELGGAYRDWIRNGGFPAAQGLLVRLSALTRTV